MKVYYERREELGPGIWHYFFKPERPLRFAAGQYADFHIRHLADDPRGSARTFTLTSLPNDEFVSFVVKIVEPMSPYKYMLNLLQEGEELRMDDPMGDLVLPKDRQRPLVFIAGGIGMASYASSLKQLIANKEERDIYLFYALRSKYERIFRDVTDAYPLQLTQVVLAPNHLSASEIRATTPPDALIYVSGSEKFVEDLRSNLGMAGATHDQIVFDFFDGYTEL